MKAAGAAPSAGNAEAAAKKSSSLSDMYSKCVQMVNENKVSTKNAFDLNLIDNMEDIVDSFMGGRKMKKREEAEKSVNKRKSEANPNPRRESTLEAEEEHRFLEASCTIEASARIYACRVDSVHTDTYRILGSINTQDVADEGEEGKEGEDGKASKKRRIIGVNTLEKHEKNILLASIEVDEQNDPMFRRQAAAFDAGGAKGLLLSHLPVAEDLSLIFNGDVPLTRATADAGAMFSGAKTLSAGKLGLGDPAVVAANLAATRWCPEVDQFRKQLYGNVVHEVVLAPHLDKMLTVTIAADMRAANPSGAPLISDLQDGFDGGFDDGFDGGAPDDMDMGGAPGMMPIQDGGLEDPANPGMVAAHGAPTSFAPDGLDGPALPDIDIDGPAGAPIGKPIEEAIAFDELFEKFCGGGGAKNQFAYFDEAWSRQPNKKDAPAAGARPGPGPLGDADVHVELGHDAMIGEGQLVAVEVGRKGSKRPIFDVSSLGQPLKPIETEPAHRHQLSERAARWQLHKDVPPYMIDRITMPSWPSWSKCDFACLGLRPHLMLKLVRKPQPQGEGPHSFSDLFSTVVVENPDAFPWLAMDSKLHDGGDDADFDRAGKDFGADEGDEDFDGSGLPAHLDVDPQDLFLRPDDKVVPGCEEDELLGGDEGVGFDGGMGGADDMDFDLVDAPQQLKTENDIGYSRNSKFVDVKLVKKHLMDCINDDITKAGEDIMQSSFQDLIARTIQRMPKSECENLSPQVCFICALHLCNEKNLELKCDADKLFGDFAVVGPPPGSQPIEAPKKMPADAPVEDAPVASKTEKVAKSEKRAPSAPRAPESKKTPPASKTAPPASKNAPAGKSAPASPVPRAPAGKKTPPASK